MQEAIAAVSTGWSRTAIGVIRLSGEDCIPCAARVLRLASGGVFGTGTPGKLTLGTLLDAQGRPLDEVMAVFFRSPNSYTGEDCCELHCHGSPTVLSLALDALFAQGVRQAQPGEFTRRAFLNGKLDLTRAEAVADLIDAQTPAAARQAMGQLSGGLQKRVEAAYDTLVGLLAHFHATVDYPDEDLAPFTAGELTEALDRATGELRALLAGYERGRLIRDGVRTAIVGRPNVGKSTLLNALVGYDRAIVTDLPGTTRDTVEECCVLDGVLLRVMDTAGIRDTGDRVEALGVERAKQAMAGAGLILVVVDRSGAVTEEDMALLRQAEGLAPTLLVWSKADLPAGPCHGERPEGVALSAKTGQGLEALAAAVKALFPTGGEGEDGSLLTSARQADCAKRALAALERAGEALAAGMPPDLVLLDGEEALNALGSLTGRNLQEDVVEQIFRRFCVGK